MREKIKFMLLALSLAIITEIGIGIGVAYHRLDNDSGFMKFVYVLHGPGEWAMYKIFPVIAEMDDHDTGLEGGFEDNAGTAILFITPVLLLSLFYFPLIWLFMIVYRVIPKLSNRSSQLQL